MRIQDIFEGIQQSNLPGLPIIFQLQMEMDTFSQRAFISDLSRNISIKRLTTLYHRTVGEHEGLSAWVDIMPADEVNRLGNEMPTMTWQQFVDEVITDEIGQAETWYDEHDY